jgi:preprotein translocase subunit SecG
MTTLLIVLILIASILMILAVLVQNPKSGMASNFGASNQVIGVRQTADFLEKFTWGSAVVILVLSLVFTIFIGGKSAVPADLQTVETPSSEVVIPQSELPKAEGEKAPVEAPAVPEAAETK